MVTSSINRVPLAEIPVNTPSPFSGYKSSLTIAHEQHSGGSSSGGLSVNRIEDVRLDNGCVLDSFTNPLRRLECSKLSDSFSVPRVIDNDDYEDDDFDESILEEIDALCEQKSIEKAEKRAQSFNSVDGTEHNNGNGSGDGGSDPYTSSEALLRDEWMENKGIFGLGNDGECREDGLSDTQSIKIGSMPNEFSRYMLSLNDRQREAACWEISKPLMIVAGPGSGKVFVSQ